MQPAALPGISEDGYEERERNSNQDGSLQRGGSIREKAERRASVLHVSEIEKVRDNRDDGMLRNTAHHHGLGHLVARKNQQSDASRHDSRNIFYPGCEGIRHWWCA